MIQLREKELDHSTFIALKKNIKRVTDKYDIPLIINDRLDIDRAAGYLAGSDGIKTDYNCRKQFRHVKITKKCVNNL